MAKCNATAMKKGLRLELDMETETKFGASVESVGAFVDSGRGESYIGDNSLECVQKLEEEIESDIWNYVENTFDSDFWGRTHRFILLILLKLLPQLTTCSRLLVYEIVPFSTKQIV